MRINASIPVIQPYVGKVFVTKCQVDSYLNAIVRREPYRLPINTLLLLYRVEDVGEVTKEFPNQIVAHFLYNDRVFMRTCVHSEEFFSCFELAKSG